ncbi:hypothetical protein BDY21DRAFT_314381 [Lineolata rhizophorae]|uniref:Translation initiation factor eIF2B subunit beta n=1 Tax=Lineolata rhizophorae TaxID=578093 RepID=A0A6A6PD18_9PEZI|nr:hypothetical protein BDY21DRAFT_314381 [Lineolata rhizophorae]
MPSMAVPPTPGLASFLKSLNANPVETSIEHFISLLKRRQIRSSRACAVATTHLLIQVLAPATPFTALLARIRQVGARLTAAQPRELAVGNMVRRVLGLVREVAEESPESASGGGGGGDSTADAKPLSHRPPLPSSISALSPLKHGATAPAETTTGTTTTTTTITAPSPLRETHAGRPPLPTQSTSYAPGPPAATSLFGIFSRPETPSPASTPAGAQSPSRAAAHMPGGAAKEHRERGSPSSSSGGMSGGETLSGLREMLDELDSAAEQIAGVALDHVHGGELILTHTASATVQRFLLAAARKRRFTLVHVESGPNDDGDTRGAVLMGSGRKAGAAPGGGGGGGWGGGGPLGGEDDEEAGAPAEERFRPLTAAGVSVVLVPDAAVFALMARVNKVVLAPHGVLANGGLVACGGAATVAAAARAHRVPVVVVSPVFKLSPLYPFDVAELIEVGDPGRVVGFGEEGATRWLGEVVDVVNPVFDYVKPEFVDLYITNLGGCAPSYLYRIVADHYRVEDVNL